MKGGRQPRLPPVEQRSESLAEGGRTNLRSGPRSGESRPHAETGADPRVRANCNRLIFFQPPEFEAAVSQALNDPCELIRPIGGSHHNVVHEHHDLSGRRPLEARPAI